MFVIVNENNGAFSQFIPNLGTFLEVWVYLPDYHQNLPINVTIYPSEGIAQSTINNILSNRNQNNKNENLKIVPLVEWIEK